MNHHSAKDLVGALEDRPERELTELLAQPPLSICKDRGPEKPRVATKGVGMPTSFC